MRPSPESPSPLNLFSWPIALPLGPSPSASNKTQPSSHSPAPSARPHPPPSAQAAARPAGVAAQHAGAGFLLRSQSHAGQHASLPPLLRAPPRARVAPPCALRDCAALPRRRPGVASSRSGSSAALCLCQSWDSSGGSMEEAAAPVSFHYVGVCFSGCVVAYPSQISNILF